MDLIGHKLGKLEIRVYQYPNGQIGIMPVHNNTVLGESKYFTNETFSESKTVRQFKSVNKLIDAVKQFGEDFTKEK
jgi:hypothetical protein